MSRLQHTMRQHGPQRHADGASQFVAYEVALKAKHPIAEETMAFTFEKPDRFQFTAGQHVRMPLLHPAETDRSGKSRFFSIASAPQEEDLLFAMRMRDTAFKRVLNRMPIGTTVRIEMMRHSMQQAFVLHEKEQRHPAFTFVVTMTQPERSTDVWMGETGRITQAMLARYVTDLASPIYYIAGLTEMVNAMNIMLKDAGVPADSMRSEDFTGFSMQIKARLPRPWRNLLMHLRRPQ